METFANPPVYPSALGFVLIKRIFVIGFVVAIAPFPAITIVRNGEGTIQLPVI